MSTSATPRRSARLSQKTSGEATPAKVATPVKKKDTAQHPFEYEFGGVVGAFFTMMALPVVIYFLYFGASKNYKFAFTNYAGLVDQIPANFSDVWSNQAMAVVCGWFALQVVMERVLFHRKALGCTLSNGKRLAYRMNGHLAFWFSLLLMGHGYPKITAEGKFAGLTQFPLSWCYDNFIQLATASIVFSTVLSVFLYIKSFAEGAMLAVGGRSGNPIYDFFIGRELNPRLGDFDLKQFCELRPGLIGWVVLNAACAVKQYELYGYVSTPMVLITIFQGLYVFDALYFEECILSTMDITTDGFGFMLAFGDLAWVPFTYSLQARYLVENSPDMSATHAAVLVALNFVGYYIFRKSNGEKNAFRTNTWEGPEPEVIMTKSGRALLVSGWWGRARKINYTGDWLMGLAWCSTTGFDCIVPYFYSIYFFILLVHRALRDDHACSQKYGQDWVKYKARVPYCFVPGVI